MERGVMVATGRVDKLGKLGAGLVSALLCAGLFCACGDDDDHAVDEPGADASMHMGGTSHSPGDGGSVPSDSGSDAEAQPDADSPKPTAGSGGSGGFQFPFDGGIPSQGNVVPASGSVCTLKVGATCDGPEDCPVPQSCCGVFDAAQFTYVSIGCALNCDALNEFELCHPDQGCSLRGKVCRRSVIVPYDFINVCVDNVPALVPTESTSESHKDQVMCGADLCDAKTEQCCLRSEFDFAQRMSIALEPYCAPVGSACTCDSVPPNMVNDEDGGMIPG
jgi:hypothetical protein